MTEQTKNVKDYVKQQLGFGQTADEIAAHLRQAGWPDDEIEAVFESVKTDFTPSKTADPISPSTHTAANASTPPNAQTPAHKPQAVGTRKGRLRTGWQLFKQSMTMLRGNMYLLRYMAMTWLWVIGLSSVFFALYKWSIRDNTIFNNTFEKTDVIFGAILLTAYLLIAFAIRLYAAGLTANVLDIFHGKRQPYQAYMSEAWSRASALFVFSCIDVTVGSLIGFVTRNLKWLGEVLSWAFRTLWSISTLFVVPIIMTSEKPSGVQSIRESVRFFRQTWGESITSKVSVNAPIALIQFGLATVFVVVTQLMIVPFIVDWNMLEVVFLTYLVATLSTFVLGSFANSVVNIALFYYAKYGTVPPAFSEGLLNRVFVARGKNGLFDKNSSSTMAQ